MQKSVKAQISLLSYFQAQHTLGCKNALGKSDRVKQKHTIFYNICNNRTKQQHTASHLKKKKKLKNNGILLHSEYLNKRAIWHEIVWVYLTIINKAKCSSAGFGYNRPSGLKLFQWQWTWWSTTQPTLHWNLLRPAENTGKGLMLQGSICRCLSWHNRARNLKFIPEDNKQS